MELNLSRDNACQKTTVKLCIRKNIIQPKLFKVGVLIHQNPLFVYMVDNDNQNTPY